MKCEHVPKSQYSMVESGLGNSHSASANCNLIASSPIKKIATNQARASYSLFRVQQWLNRRGTLSDGWN